MLDTMTTDWTSIKLPQPPKPAGYCGLRIVLTHLAVSEDQEERHKLLQMAKRWPHHVRELASSREWEMLSNCHAYALGIADHPDYRELAMSPRFRKLPVVCEKFFDEAYNKGVIVRRSKGHCEPCDILTYNHRDDGHTHSAIVVVPNRLLRSKWAEGKVYEHGMLDVPVIYGDPDAVYAPPQRLTDIIALLKDWHRRP